MKTETLKKIVELADGFEIVTDDVLDFEISTPDSALMQSWCNHFRSEIWKQIYYPLLLRRAVEGCEHIIIFDNHRILTCLSLEDEKQTFNYSDYPKTDYLTPQEQAIEACLIELLEVK